MTDGNTYRLESEKEGIPYWDVDKIFTQLNWLYSKTRSRINGKPVYKARTFPGYYEGRAADKWQKAFTKQDEIKTLYRKIEATNHLPRLYIETVFGSVLLNSDLAEFYMSNSEVANLHAKGWNFRVE